MLASKNTSFNILGIFFSSISFSILSYNFSNRKIFLNLFNKKFLDFSLLYTTIKSLSAVFVVFLFYILRSVFILHPSKLTKTLKILPPILTILLVIISIIIGSRMSLSGLISYQPSNIILAAVGIVVLFAVKSLSVIFPAICSVYCLCLLVWDFVGNHHQLYWPYRLRFGSLLDWSPFRQRSYRSSDR